MTTGKELARVLHPITRLIVGGAQENTLYTATLLDPDRYQVDVICGPQTGSEGSLIEEARQRGISLTILPNLLRQISPRRDLRALPQMVKIIRQGRYDIVHTHSSKAGIIGRLAARLAGTPVIVHTVHGWSFHEYMPASTRQLYIWLERWMARLTDALIVVTGRDIDKGLQAGIGRAGQYHLIRSAIPLDEFQPGLYEREAERAGLGIPDGAAVIGNVGRFSAQKNPLDWIRVAGQVAAVCPQAFFLMVGDGPLRGEVEAEIQKQGLDKRILLTGLRRDAARMMAAMDIFLLTSLWEGLPRVIPQAMAMNLPVVANLADGTAEAIQDGINGYLCAPGDLAQMAGQVVELVNHPLKRLEMGANGREIAARDYDLKTMIAQIDQLYTQLLTR